jgi:hypothetical protein
MEAKVDRVHLNKSGWGTFKTQVGGVHRKHKWVGYLHAKCASDSEQSKSELKTSSQRPTEQHIGKTEMKIIYCTKQNNYSNRYNI